MKVYILVDERKNGREAIVGVFSSQVTAFTLRDFHRVKESVDCFNVYWFKPAGRVEKLTNAGA